MRLTKSQKESLYNMIMKECAKILSENIKNKRYVNEAYPTPEIRTSVKNNKLFNVIKMTKTEDGNVEYVTELKDGFLGSIKPENCIVLSVGKEYKYSDISKKMLELHFNRGYNENGFFFHIISMICKNVGFWTRPGEFWWNDAQYTQPVDLKTLKVRVTNREYKKDYYGREDWVDFSFIIENLEIEKKMSDDFAKLRINKDYVSFGSGVLLSSADNDEKKGFMKIEKVIGVQPKLVHNSVKTVDDRKNAKVIKDPIVKTPEEVKKILGTWKRNSSNPEREDDKTTGIYSDIVEDMINYYKWAVENVRKGYSYNSNGDRWTVEVLKKGMLDNVKYYKEYMDGTFWRWVMKKYPKFSSELKRIGVIK